MDSDRQFRLYVMTDMGNTLSYAEKDCLAIFLTFNLFDAQDLFGV